MLDHVLSPLHRSLTFLIVVSLACKPVHSQGTSRSVTAERPTCPSCEIVTVLERRVAHEGTEGELLKEPNAVAVDGRGHLIVARGTDGPPVVFDGQGRFMKVIGRTGSGPNEYRNVQRVVILPGDSVLLLDRDLRRLSILDPSWRYRRSAPLPDGALNIDRAGDGRFVVNAELHDARRFGHPAHIIDAAGNYVESFGAGSGAVLPGRSDPLLRLIAASTTPTDVWIASVQYRYRLERWSLDGRRILTIDRQAEWFRTLSPAERPFSYFTRSEAALPWVLGMVEDRSHRLWTVVRRADPRWKSAVRFNRSQDAERSSIAVIEDRERAYDSVIEVFDGVAGGLISSKTYDQVWSRFAAPGLLALYSEDARGRATLELHSVSLSGSNRLHE